MEEKKHNSRINTYLRAPGLVSVATLMFVGVRNGTSQVHFSAAAAVIVSEPGVRPSHAARTCMCARARACVCVQRGGSVE